MKKLSFLLLTCAQFLAYPSLQGQQDVYAQIMGGLNFLQTDCGYGSRLDTQMGYLASGSLGYRFAYGLRAEGEVAYRINEANNIHFFGDNYPLNLHYQTTSVMGNLLWDLPLCRWGCNLGNYKPYIGAGVGCDWQNYDTDDFHGCLRAKNGIFSWQVMAGVGYKLSCDWELSLGYNYHRSGTRGIYNQALTIGVLYNIN